MTADANRVYLSTPGGVAALDGATGETIWEAPGTGTAGLVGPPYAVVGDIVIVDRGGALAGLRATSGELLWNREDTPTGALIGSEPDGLYATDGETVVSYDPLTGTPRWSAPLEPGGTTIGLSAGAELVCALRLVSPPTHSRLTCFARSDGSVLWSHFVNPPPWVAITATRVVVAGLDPGEGPGWMGLDPLTGETIWKIADLSTEPPVLSDPRDVLYGCRGECVAVRGSDGDVLWRTDLGEEAGPVAVGENSVFVVGSRDDPGSLHVLDATTGSFRTQVLPDASEEPGGFCGAPAVGADLLFAFGCRGNLHAYRISSLELFPVPL